METWNQEQTGFRQLWRDASHSGVFTFHPAVWVPKKPSREEVPDAGTTQHPKLQLEPQAPLSDKQQHWWAPGCWGATPGWEPEEPGWALPCWTLWQAEAICLHLEVLYGGRQLQHPQGSQGLHVFICFIISLLSVSKLLLHLHKPLQSSGSPEPLILRSSDVHFEIVPLPFMSKDLRPGKTHTWSTAIYESLAFSTENKN